MLDANQKAELDRVFSLIVQNNLAQPQGVRASRLPFAQPDGDEPNPGILDFQDAVYGPDHLRSGVAVARCVHPLGRGTDAGLGDPLLGAGAKTRTAGGRRISPNSIATSNGWACSAISRCSGYSRACNYRDGKSAYLGNMPLVEEYLRKACERYRELNPLLTLLDEWEGCGKPRNQTVGYTF